MGDRLDVEAQEQQNADPFGRGTTSLLQGNYPPRKDVQIPWKTAALLSRPTDMPLLTPTAAPRFSPSQTSILTEVEAQAFWNASPLLPTPLLVAGRRVGMIYSYERRIFGLGLGVRDGVILLDAAPDGFAVASLAERIAAAVPADLSTYRMAGPGAVSVTASNCAIRGDRTTAVAVAKDLQEVLPLGNSYAEFLAKLGRSTRRNVQSCRRVATEQGLDFEWSTTRPTVSNTEMKLLCRSNMPTPASFRRVEALQHLIGTKKKYFHAALRDANGRVVSACGGFLDGDLALMLYQYNDRDCRSLNPSLTMRSFVIERLCGEATRHLAFVGKCSGLLRLVCDRTPAAELLITRNSVVSRLKQLACGIADPRSRIGRLMAVPAAAATEQIPRFPLAGSRDGLLWH